MQLWGFNLRATHTHTQSYKAQPSARGHPQIPHFITRPAIPDWSKSMLDNSSTLIPSSLHPCLPPPIPPPFVSPRLASLPLPSHLSGCIVTLIRGRSGNNAVVQNVSVAIADSLASAASIISPFARPRVTFLSPGCFLSFSSMGRRL